MAKKVALIDDSRVMRSILRKAIMMSEMGIEDIVEAENGKVGLEMIKSNYDSLDLIFTDLDMPEMTGVEMMRHLKADGLSKVPIVIVSTVGDNQMRQTCRELGAVDYINKPFSHEDIVQFIQTFWK